MKPLILDGKQINWTLLKEQKAWLVEQSGWAADGLLNFLDYIQDNAVEQGIAKEVDVFTIDNSDQ